MHLPKVQGESWAGMEAQTLPLTPSHPPPRALKLTLGVGLLSPTGNVTEMTRLVTLPQVASADTLLEHQEMSILQ